MACIIIPATKSLTVTNKIPDGNINEDVITIGRDGIYNYFSYLFFDISTIPCNVLISYAELVLFKVDNFYNDVSKIFGIYPLSDYFSTYTTYNNSPTINGSMQENFHPITSKVSVTVVLTSFVSLWNRNSYLNTGIMLFGKNKDTLTKYGSSINQDSYLIPFLKVCFIPAISKNVCHQNYQYDNNPPVKEVRVIGTVGIGGKYESVVNVEVTRNISGHKDNYYVVDEYDNSTKDTPLTIDKTYSIPVVPRTTYGDVENVNIYGSYKE